MSFQKPVMTAFLILILVLLNPPLGLAVGIGVSPSRLDYYATSDSPISKGVYVINTGDVRTQYDLYFDQQYQSMFTFSNNGFQLEPSTNMEANVNYNPSLNPSRTDFSTYLYIKGVEVGKTLQAGIRVPVTVTHQVSTTTRTSTSSTTTSTSSRTSSTRSFPLMSSDPHVVSALAYLASQQSSDGSIGGFQISCWVTMAIASAGYNPDDWKRSGTSITDYLVSNRNQMDQSKVTDIAKFILSITAARRNPRNVGGVNYVTMLEGTTVNNQFGDETLYNDDAWAIIALISAGVDKNTVEISNSVSYLKNHQNADGGWSWHSGASSADDTAATMMALIAAGEQASSPPVTNAVSYLRSQLASGGGFTFDSEANSASDAWAIMALAAASIDPTTSDWIQSGTSPVAHLMSLQNEDGSFSWKQGQSGSTWWTAYAIPALLGKPYPVTNSVQTPTTTTSSETSSTTTTSSETSTTTTTTNTSTSTQVHIRIEDLTSTVWKGWVQIPQSTTINCHNSGKAYTIQGDSVLAALDKASKSGGFSYQVSDQWYLDTGFYVDSVAGHGAQGQYGWMYRVNYSLGGTSINNYVVHSGDDILIYWGTDGVRPLRVEVDHTEVGINETVTVTVKYRDDSGGDWVPLTQARVHANGDYTTDSKGEVRLKFNETSVYGICAEKWGDAPSSQFVRSDITQVGVGVPVPEIWHLLPVLALCVAAASIIRHKASKGRRWNEEAEKVANARVLLILATPTELAHDLTKGSAI